MPRLPLTLVLPLIFGLIFVVIPNQCKDEHLERFDSEMKRMFEDDKLRESISKYLDKVPSSHKSRSHAMRIGTPAESDKTVTDSTRMANSYPNQIKRVLGAILSRAHWKCKKCKACPTCPACPHYTCEDPCPPCKAPDYCKPPPPGEKCPPKPVCQECNNQTTLAPTVSTSTTTTPPAVPLPASSTTTAPTTSSAKPSASSSVGPVLTSAKPTSTTTQPPTTTTKSPATTTSQAPESEPSVVPRPATTDKPTPVSATTLVPGTASPTKASLDATIATATTPASKPAYSTKPAAHDDDDDEVPPELVEELAKLIVAEKDHSKDPEAVAAATDFLEHTTKRPRKGKNSTRRSRRRTRRPDGMDLKLENTTSVNSSLTKKADGTQVISSTATNTVTISGVDLFNKYMKSVSNATLREQVMKMLEATPENVGGDEMREAHNILVKFGENPIVVNGKKGKNRSYVFRSAKDNVKAVVGHILARYRCIFCKCPKCPICEQCEMPLCPTPKPGFKCPVCPVNPPCPAPEGCPTHPPCPVCRSANQMADCDDNGDVNELDDVDSVQTYNAPERNETVTCKGFTCKYQKTCGTADLNALTPKGSQSGYMVGGEKQKYGEWPSYVRLQIRYPNSKLVGLCGGVLISDRHILTAAHCTQMTIITNPIKLKPEAYTVILAEHHKDKKDKFEEQRRVKSICRASKFNDTPNRGTKHDYAVLTMDKPVKFNDYIQPACLPYKPLSLPSAKCFVIGLGMTKYDKSGAHEFASIVEKMPMKCASCKVWGIKNDDRSRHCFTKNNDRGDTCGGDSGGPVLCLSKDKRWTVTGLVSYGSEACDGTESSGWVAVYTRVPSLLKQMNEDCEL